MRRLILWEAGLGMLLGLMFGVVLGRQMDLLSDLVADGLFGVLRRPLAFTAIAGALAGWALVVTAERVTTHTGGWLGIPAGLGLLIAGLAASGITVLMCAGFHEVVLLAFVGVFWLGGGLSGWWRSTIES